MKQLIKVIKVFDDDTTNYIDGQALKDWESACLATALLYQNHFGSTGFENIKWKSGEKNDNSGNTKS